MPLARQISLPFKNPNRRQKRVRQRSNTPPTMELAPSESSSSSSSSSGSSSGSGNTSRSSSFQTPLNRRMSLNAVGTQWSVEMSISREIGSSFEAVMCLRRIEDLLGNIDKVDRKKFCKTDYENCISQLQSRPQIWNPELHEVALEIMYRYFDSNPFQKLPHAVLQDIFMWLPINDFCPTQGICREWQMLGSSDEVWKVFYNYRFLRNNPNSMPEIKTSYISAFKNRLADPHVGDKVEVAWRGKFRLEAVDVYQGLAWWVAEVVDKHVVQGKYKIRYPGWDSRWDEWVTRSRLRWAVEKNTIMGINLEDAVEIWCCGATVPGAWLESRVKKVRGDRYCVGRVLSTGSLWVERERLRPIKQSSHFFTETEEQEEATSPPTTRRRGLTLPEGASYLRRTISLPAVPESVQNMRQGSCTIM